MAKKQIELYDFVRPKVAPLNSIWRVIEIKGNQITAQMGSHELEPKEIKRVTSTADFFELLDEEEDGNDD
ncbi:MAG: hypothetical protein RMY28_006945 [Nostoc sp. ChiSLP01]|nr:hypothetical protein [Nostoc sp. CmiSLP01]MDZ8285557.1 hypothetical protein [Nostoc sp. ChiSLP01]